MKKMGLKIKERREALGLTQEEVASACGVTQQAIQRLENGEILRPRYLDELAAVLGTTKAWLKGAEDTAFAAGGTKVSGGLGDTGYSGHRRKIFELLEAFDRLSEREQAQFLLMAQIEKKDPKDRRKK